MFELRSNYGRGNESNWDLLQKDLSKHPCIQCPSPWCFPFLDHVSTGHSWTLTSNTGSVSCGNTALTLGSWWTQASFVPSYSLLQSCGSYIIKSSWAPMSNSLWYLSPVGSQSLCQIPRLKKTVVVLKLPNLYNNFFRKIILQLVDCALGHFLVGWKAISSSERAYVTNCINKGCRSQRSLLCQTITDPCFCRRPSVTQRQSWLCFGTVPEYRCTKCFIEHSVWLVGIDSKCKFTPAAVLLGLYLCLDIFYFFIFLVGPNIILSMVI